MSYGSDCPNYYREDGKYGNRNIQIYDGTDRDGVWNLVERNRFGKTGPAPDDAGGDGITITASKNIIRYNDVFNSQNNCVLFKTGADSYSDNNRFYNNTLYYSGRYDNSYDAGTWQGVLFRWYGSYARSGNVIKNNVLYDYNTGAGDWTGGDVDIYTNNTVIYNWCTDAAAGKCSGNGDPNFVNTSISDPTSTTAPNLALQGGSDAIDGGTYLTQANGSGNASVTLVVDDALYFQDGTWGSSLATLEADWIAVGTTVSAADKVQISSINYGTDTITLASAITWADDDYVWLYKDSDGDVVLYGDAPDQGAHEFSGTPGNQTMTVGGGSQSITVGGGSHTLTVGD